MSKNNIKKEIVIFLLIMRMVSCNAFGVRAGSFTIVGPGGGGAMYHATINPREPNEVLVACDMTGAYISHDGGHSWRMFNLRSTVRFFSFDPLEPRTIYADTQAFWRSTDHGESWKLVCPMPSTVRNVRMSSDHADEIIVADPNPVGEIVAFAIDPADSNTLVAGAVKEGKAAVFLSKDKGGIWEKMR